MILINLLPHREAARKRRKERFYLQFGLAALLGLGLGVAVYAVLQQQLTQQEARNALLTERISKLDEQIKEIAGLQTELKAMRSRQQAVEGLQSDRNVPVYLLHELVQQTPDGVVLKTLKQDGRGVTLAGSAQSQERVSEFLRNLDGQASALMHPELVEVVANMLNTGGREPRRVFNFVIKFQLRSASGLSLAPAARTGN